MGEVYIIQFSAEKSQPLRENGGCDAARGRITRFSCGMGLPDVGDCFTMWRASILLLCHLTVRFCRKLSAGVVDGVGGGEEELGDGHHGVAVTDEGVQDAGQRLRCVQGGVVKQDDTAWAHLPTNALRDGGRIQVFPVQTITTGNLLNTVILLTSWPVCDPIFPCRTTLILR